MATHNYLIENQAGSAFRLDLNNALKAIAESNSASTEPATSFAYQFWADTSTDTLKIRNGSNTGWLDVLTLSTGIPTSYAELEARIAALET